MNHLMMKIKLLEKKERGEKKNLKVEKSEKLQLRTKYTINMQL